MEIDGIILNQKTWDEMKQDGLDGVSVIISKHLPDNMQILISDGHIVAIIKEKEEVKRISNLIGSGANRPLS